MKRLHILTLHFERDLMNRNFARKWVGRGGPLTWPPRSPDLTPLNFAYWVTYRMLCRSRHCPPLCLTCWDNEKSCSQSYTHHAYYAWTELAYRHDVCWATHSAFIEQCASQKRDHMACQNTFTTHCCTTGRDSWVGTVTRYGVDGPVIES